MVTIKKNGRKVKQSIRIRISRPMYPSFAANQQSARRRESLSEDFLRLLIRLLAVSSLIVFLPGSLLRWHINQEQEDFDRLAAVRTGLLEERAELLAQRDKLASKSRIVAAATVRLGLQLPEKEQEHRLY